MTKRGQHETSWNKRHTTTTTTTINNNSNSARFSNTLPASSIISGKSEADDDHCFKYTKIPEIKPGIPFTPRPSLKRNSLANRSIGNSTIFTKESFCVDACSQRTLEEEMRDRILLPLKTSMRLNSAGTIKQQYLQWTKQYHPKEFKGRGDQSTSKLPNVSILSRQSRVSQSSRESRNRRASSSSDDWKGIYLTSLHRRHKLIVRHPGTLHEVEPTEKRKRKTSSATEEFSSWNIEGGIEPPMEVTQPNVHRVSLIDEETVGPQLAVSHTPPFPTHPPGKNISSEQAPNKILQSNNNNNNNGGGDGGGDGGSLEIIRRNSADLTAFCRRRRHSVENGNEDSTHQSPVRDLMSVLTVSGISNKKRMKKNNVQSLKATSQPYITLSDMEEMPPSPVQNITEITNSLDMEISSSKSRSENISSLNLFNVYESMETTENDSTSEIMGKLTATEVSPRKTKRKGSDWAKLLFRRGLSHSLEAKTDTIKNDSCNNSNNNSSSSSVSAGTTTMTAMTDHSNQSKHGSKIKYPHPHPHPHPPPHPPPKQQQRLTSALSLNFTGKAMEMNLPVFALPSPNSQRHSIISHNPQHSLLSEANFFLVVPPGRRRYNGSIFKSVMTASSNSNMGKDDSMLKGPQPLSKYSSKSSIHVSRNHSTCVFDGDFTCDGVNPKFARKSLQKSTMSNRSDAESGMGFFSATQCFSPVIPYATLHPSREFGS
ncbi:hypothetical protein MOQ_008951 [Trypanosoma cruzi marinkellei]|uniref:Uncharacterized protein n=1 Tax=Trypanosoma cruzi marinkellei TaxID=85056 RepID=K2LXE0_TRYCR|nr:hypothetical protein MOQ_008951 [Trypanosoma cruzi marinkellei]